MIEIKKLNKMKIQITKMISIIKIKQKVIKGGNG